MSTFHTHAQARRSSLHAVITRADGTKEDLGLIAFYHRNPLINRSVNAYIQLKRFLHDCTRPE